MKKGGLLDADALLKLGLRVVQHLDEVYIDRHGPLWDLTDNSDSISLIESFLKAGKAVATVCHASAALLNVKNLAGDFAIKGKAVTGFTNSEEEPRLVDNKTHPFFPNCVLKMNKRI